MENNSDNKLKIDVELLKKDMTQLNGLFDRLDITIEKLGEVSSNLAKILAVHENRITKQDDTDKQLHSMVELLFSKVEDRRKDVEVAREDFRKEVANLHSDIVQEMKQLQASQNTHFDTVNARIHALEKWKWMIIGAGILVGYIANFLSKIL